MAGHNKNSSTNKTDTKIKMQKEDGSLTYIIYPKYVYLGIIAAFSNIIVSVTIIIAFSMETSWLNLFQWYSYWAIFSTIFAMIIVIAFAYIELRVVQEHSTNKRIVWQFCILNMLRDWCLMVLFIQLSITSISFWISWACNPYTLRYSSIASHSVLYVMTIVVMLMTVINVRWTSLLFSIYFSIAYYFFTMDVFYLKGTWIYAGMNPSNNFWYIVAISIPISECLLYICAKWVNYYKNKFYSWIWAYDISKTTLTIEEKDAKRMDHVASITIYIIMSVFAEFVIISSILNVLDSGIVIKYPVYFIFTLAFNQIYIVIDMVLVFTGTHASFGDYSWVVYLSIAWNSLFAVVGIIHSFGLYEQWVYIMTLGYMILIAIHRILTTHILSQN